jgi:hypothetical protein
MKRVPVVIAVPLFLLAACGGSSDSHKRHISSADLGDRWPLTVSSGTLRCKGSGGTGEVTFTASGTTYWVNGPAKQTHRYVDFGRIWLDGTDGVKVDASALTDLGLQLCS